MSSWSPLYSRYQHFGFFFKLKISSAWLQYPTRPVSFDFNSNEKEILLELDNFSSLRFNSLTISRVPYNFFRTPAIFTVQTISFGLISFHRDTRKSRASSLMVELIVQVFSFKALITAVRQRVCVCVKYETFQCSMWSQVYSLYFNGVCRKIPIENPLEFIFSKLSQELIFSRRKQWFPRRTHCSAANKVCIHTSQRAAEWNVLLFQRFDNIFSLRQRWHGAWAEHTSSSSNSTSSAARGTCRSPRIQKKVDNLFRTGPAKAPKVADSWL